MPRVLSPKELQHLIQNDHWEGKVHHQNLSCIRKPSAVYRVVHLSSLAYVRSCAFLILSDSRHPVMPVKRANGKDFGQEWRIENHLKCQRQNNGAQMSHQCPAAKVAESIANTTENKDNRDYQNQLRSKVDDDRTFRQARHHWMLSIELSKALSDGYAMALCSRS